MANAHISNIEIDSHINLLQNGVHPAVLDRLRQEYEDLENHYYIKWCAQPQHDVQRLEMERDELERDIAETRYLKMMQLDKTWREKSSSADCSISDQDLIRTADEAELKHLEDELQKATEAQTVAFNITHRWGRQPRDMHEHRMMEQDHSRFHFACAKREQLEKDLARFKSLHNI